MPGTQLFEHLNYGKEATPGTPVAPTRQFYAEGTAVLLEDRNWNLHENENRGRRSEIGRPPTQQTEDVRVEFTSVDGISYDDLVWPFSDLNGTATGVGGAADKTWTQTPSMTATNSPKAYSLDIGDDVQNWRVQYGQFESFELSAALNEKTQMSGAMFGQRMIKTAQANPATNVSIKIPGELWTLKVAATAAGLPGASILSNTLLSWRLTVRTGLIWRHYMDGNMFGAQSVERKIGGDVEFLVESTAGVVTEFYDRYTAGTQFFARLKATGPTLGGSNYSAQLDLNLVLPEVHPIDSEQDGINVYRVVGRLADDGTTPPISPVIVNSIAALP